MNSQSVIAPLLDTANAGSGQIPVGLILEDDSESIHPGLDPLIVGTTDDEVDTVKSDTPDTQSALHDVQGQCREPFEFGEILSATGLEIPPHEMAIRYYKERALPYLMAYPSQAAPVTSEQIPEGLSTWNIGESMETIDWFHTIASSPVIVPGVTTLRRECGYDSGISLAPRPVDLDLYVDCSGSMPNPQVNTSFITLAGAVLSLSALRAGATVQVTLWSGKNQYDTTNGFVRSETQVLGVLCGYLGGSTAFPIHLLRESHAQKRENPCLIAILSDDGVTTLFDQDEKGNSGWNIASTALENAGMPGLMILILNWEFPNSPDSKSYYSSIHEDLHRAQREQFWHIAAVSSLEEMLTFSREFSEQHYRQQK